MRKIGSSRGAVTAYPRQLESLIRLAEAHAKMRYSALVEIADVEEAKRCCITTLPSKSLFCHHRLHREALKQAATDPKTGIIDVSILTTGISASERQRRQALAREVHKLLQTKFRSGGMVSQSAVFDMLKEQSQVVSSITSPY